MAKRLPMEKIDITKYVGHKCRIETAEIKESKFGRVIYLETENIPFQDGDSLPDNKKLSASKMLSIKFSEENGCYIGINSETDKFCQAKNIDVENDLPENLDLGVKLDAFIGKEVVCQKNENGYLTIA